MNASTIVSTNVKPGQVWSVAGHGLMLVVDVGKANDGQTVVAYMMPHGFSKDEAWTLRGHWFPLDRLRTRADDATVLHEWKEARARNVACNSLDCWCVEPRRAAESA
jgi:hypothetical protein